MSYGEYNPDLPNNTMSESERNTNQSRVEVHPLVLRWNERAAKERRRADRYKGDTGKKSIAKAMALESAAVELEDYLKDNAEAE